MSYWRLGTLQRSKIGFGCLVAVGSIATAGIAEIEIQGKVFSGWISSISESIRLGIDSPRQQEQQDRLVTADHILSPFTYIGAEAKKFYPHVKSFFEGVSGVVDFLKTSWKETISGVWSFLSTLIEQKTFKRIFDNIHNKVWNFISFFLFGSEDRKSFMELFWGEKWQSTSLATRFLLGKEIEGNKFFKAKPDVFSFFLLSWMDNPKNVTGKFERLFKKVEELIKETQKIGTSFLSRDDGAQAHIQIKDRVYWLDVPTVKAYLEVKKGWNETIFNGVWKSKVMTKIMKGTSDSTKAETWVKDALNPWTNSNRR